MRTTSFLFAMFASIMASAQVTNVEPIGATYANKTVSFRVWWNADSRSATHLSKVWVWVDYIKVNTNNITSGNSWTRAAVSAATPAASVSYDGNNRQGFWLQGNSGSYSATVTVQLNISETKFNWCAYVSDYPPNVTAANGTYTFKGTPPFTLTAANGTTSQTVTGTTLAASALTVTPTTIRDKTECPGVFCIYTGNDLYIDATHLCQQRTSGAKNWEAYIRDARDSKIYRIVQMSDGNWYFAQDLDYRGGSNSIYNASYCTTYIYGVTAANSGVVCPSGWDVPTNAVWTQLLNTIDGGPNNWAAFWPQSSGGTDIYGYTAVSHCVYISASGGEWVKMNNTGTTAQRDYWSKANACVQMRHHRYYNDNRLECLTNYPPAYAPIRCYRSL
jgi:uncharacterized protein (TIGR02145 family)